MFIFKENVRKYWKNIDTPNLLVDLYNSNNQSYIDSTSKNFIVNSVTAWSTTQTYVLNQPISIKDITANSTVSYIQANAGWTVKISATTTDGEVITILERDHGYGQQTTLTNTVDFNSLKEIMSITIYAYCYRSSTSYCYGSINIDLIYTQRIIEPATSSYYDFYEDVDVYEAKKEIVRKYYKYNWEAKESPIFINADTTDGVSIITGGNNYNITGTNSGTTISVNQIITFDMGETSGGINSIGFIGVVVANSYPGAVMKDVQCSEDNSTWVTISSSFGGRGDYLTNPLIISSPNNYRYIRFTSGVDDTRYGTGGMYRLTINYQKRYNEETTEDDYDVYEDEDIYKVFKF